MALSQALFNQPLVNLSVGLILAQFRPVPGRPWSPGSSGHGFGSSSSPVFDALASVFFFAVSVVIGIMVFLWAVKLVFVVVVKVVSAIRQLAAQLRTIIAHAENKLGPVLIVALSAMLFVATAGLTGVWSHLFSSAGTADSMLLVQSLALGLAAGFVTGVLRHVFQRKRRVLEALVSAALTKELLTAKINAASLVRVPLHAMIGLAVGSIQTCIFHDPATFVTAVASASGGGPPPPFLGFLLWILFAVGVGGVLGGLFQALFAKIAVKTLAAAALGAAKGGLKGWSTKLVELYLQTGAKRHLAHQLVDEFCREKGLWPTSTLAESLRAHLLMVYYGEMEVVPLTVEERKFAEELICHVEARRHGVAAPLFDSSSEVWQLRHPEYMGDVLRSAFRDGMWSGCMVAVVKCAFDAVMIVVGG
jgi:hypothetical protein